jgi:hypothetical protein
VRCRIRATKQPIANRVQPAPTTASTASESRRRPSGALDRGVTQHVPRFTHWAVQCTPAGTVTHRDDPGLEQSRLGRVPVRRFDLPGRREPDGPERVAARAEQAKVAGRIAGRKPAHHGLAVRPDRHGRRMDVPCPGVDRPRLAGGRRWRRARAGRGAHVRARPRPAAPAGVIRSRIRCTSAPAAAIVRWPAGRPQRSRRWSFANASSIGSLGVGGSRRAGHTRKRAAMFGDQLLCEKLAALVRADIGGLAAAGSAIPAATTERASASRRGRRRSGPGPPAPYTRRSFRFNIRRRLFRCWNSVSSWPTFPADLAGPTVLLIAGPPPAATGG